MTFAGYSDVVNRPDVRMLPRLIEVAEEGGRHEHAQMLRGWLAEAKAKKQPAISLRKLTAQEPNKVTRLPAQDLLTEEDCQNAAPDETIITTSLDCYSRDIRYRLYDREVTDISQLTRWRQRFLPEIGLSATQIKAVNRFQDCIGFPIGSDLELLTALPPKSPFGIDLRDGRLPTDVLGLLRRLARGELTFRDASVELGSAGLARVRPHQRCCSVVQRHARTYANECRMAFHDAFHGQGWWTDCELCEFPAAKPAFGLRLRLATTLDVAKSKLDLRPKPVYGGMSWRGIPVDIVEENDAHG